MLINPVQTNNPYSTDALNNLITQIDNKMLCDSLGELNYIRYATSTKADLDEYEELSFYRDILKTKMLGCNCLEKYQLDHIVSSIKRLLNSPITIK